MIEHLKDVIWTIYWTSRLHWRTRHLSDEQRRRLLMRFFHVDYRKVEMERLRQNGWRV